MTGAPAVTLADIQAAQEVLRGVVTRTPMEGARWLSELAGGPVLLKAENLQRAGSFKIRGAYLRLSRLSGEERAAGVVAASAGNHAQGVALAAQMLGIKAVVYMPHGASLPKERATRGYGAEIRFEGHTVDEALEHARTYAAETGAVLVHPFDHPDIVAGQGTCGLEILEQCPDVKTVIVSTGGGGLLAGVATAIKALKPDVKVIGVQAEGAAAYPDSLAAGRPVPVESMRTMADGIAVARPGEVPFEAINRLVDEVRTVSEESLSRAIVLLLERAKLVVEPAGAAAVAALMDRAGAFATPAVAILSGGNIDPLLMMNVIRHGLAAAGRFLVVRVRITDRPGGLAALLNEIADAQANVIEIAHERTSPLLNLDEVEVHLQLETRGGGHTEAVIERLRECGYEVTPQG